MLPGDARSVFTRTRSRLGARRDHRRGHRQRERRAGRDVEEHPARGQQALVRVRRPAAVRMHLEVEVRVDPVRVARVADEPDRLPGLDARAALQALRERDPDLAAAAVVVPVREVVVQVDVVVGRPALAVEVEHAAGPAGAGVEPDATRLGRQRERVPGREDVDALVRPLRPRRAVVVAELDRAQDGEHDLARVLRLRGLRERAGAGRGRPESPQPTLRRRRRGPAEEVLGLSSGCSP